MTLNVALLTDGLITNTETFIQAHREINAKVFFYYGGIIPQFLDDKGYLQPHLGLHARITRILRKKLNKFHLNITEETLAKSLKQNNINVILAEYGTTGANIVPICKDINIPLVTIFHGYDATVKTILKEYETKYQELFRYAKYIIAVSFTMKQKLIELGCPQHKIIITPCAPNDKFLKLNPTFNESKSFVAIGRFVNKKAPHYTILAIKKVMELHNDVKLYFAGDGDLFETTQNLVNYFKLENNVKLLGKITPEEYALLLTRVTGFVQHSISATNGDMEGTPVAVLEASAAGIPVIATKHGGIPDVIIDKKTGLLSEEHDVNGMAQNIIKIIDTPELAHNLGQEGKQYIKKYYSMQKHLTTVLQVLQDATR